MMRRTGIAELPLHYGKAPSWLFQRMVKLAEGIVSVMVLEFGADEMLHRIADPFWFQALSCVLGFDWHSSGTTTVTTAALKSAIKPEVHGLAVLGGKGNAARAVPDEIAKLEAIFDISAERLRYASKMAAKVDNAAIQDNHKLYQHAFFVSESGNWAVVQQGMNVQSKYARRYHWLGEHVKSFVVEPHEAIMGSAKLERVLDMTARESEEARNVSLDLVRESPDKLGKLLNSISKFRSQKTLANWTDESEVLPAIMVLPRRVDWEALKQAYEFQPDNYEELLAIKGIGPATVRALALISELIYGESPSWRDPVKYSFAVGGKDGVPYPVDRKTMDKTIEVIKTGVEEARVGKEEKLKAIRRLKDFLPAP
jgi:hypothetical protein